LKNQETLKSDGDFMHTKGYIFDKLS